MEEKKSKSHWEKVYQTKSSKEVSWYTPHLENSLKLIRLSGVSDEAQIIDVGGGASTLADDLIGSGFEHLTVLDISGEALETAKKRFGEKASKVNWIEADITQADLPNSYYDLWHDRATFHFLVDPRDRKKYLNLLRSSLKPEGRVIIATFGPDGPEKCSGLPIVRYSPESLFRELGEGFTLIESFKEVHKTPFGTTQEFTYGLFIWSPV